jgi:hypothetical protein
MQNALSPVFAVLVLNVLATTVSPVHAQTALDLTERSSERYPSYVITLPDHEDEEDDDVACNPDPPCFDNENRFVDCGNGTITDQVTGLIWLQETTCMGLAYYVDANEGAAELGDGTDPACNLTDSSCPGDWRLASKDEWQVVMDLAQSNGCGFPDSLGFPDTEGSGCWSEGDAFRDVTSFFGYITSTTKASNPGSAWYASTFDGSLSTFPKTGGCEDVPPDTDCDPFPPIYSLPVRGGN